MKRQNNTISTIGSELGKLPPASIEAEESVLGSLLMNPGAMYEISDLFSPESFYKDEHQKIANAIGNLFDNSKSIDIITVGNELKRLGQLDEVGGPLFVAQLTTKAIPLSKVLYHYEIVFQTYIKREVIRVSSELSSYGYDDSSDMNDLQDKLNSEIDAINEKIAGKKQASHISTLVKQSREALKKREQAAKDKKLSGIRGPLVDLDKLTQGWQPGVYVLAARPGQGKCLGKGVKILMYDGNYKVVEDVKEGDQLMGPDSMPRNVLSTTAGMGQMYIVKQKNGYNYRCNEDHILALKVSGKDFQRQYGSYKEISVRDYLNLPSRLKDKLKGFKVGVEFIANDMLTIDPYILGIWLGDGAKKDFDISNPDVEIHDELKSFAEKENLPFRVYKAENKCDSIILTNRKEVHHNENSMFKRLARLNLLNNKHIPKEYLINSRKNRLQLLAGLLDADGYLCDGRSYEITQKSEILATQIVFLCNTLGFGTFLSHETKSIKKIGFSDMYYRIHITGDVYEIPLKVKRKIAVKYAKRGNYATTYGVEVIKDNIDYYYGFELDGDGLFLLEDCTVTHNTAVSLSIGKSAAMEGHPVCFFSLEMDAIRLADRLIMGEADMKENNFRTGYMAAGDWSEFEKAATRLSKLPIYIDGNPVVGTRYIKSHSRLMQKRGLCDLIVIDYLQLFDIEYHEKENRERQVAKTTRELKIISKQLNVPIIVLSQLNRSIEGRDKRPNLTNLRESGAIEQDADCVMFIHRPWYYGIKQDSNGNSWEGVGLIIVEKNREGPLGDVRFSHNPSITKIKDWVDPNRFTPQQPTSNRDRQLPQEKDDVNDIPDNDSKLPF